LCFYFISRRPLLIHSPASCVCDRAFPPSAVGFHLLLILSATARLLIQRCLLLFHSHAYRVCCFVFILFLFHLALSSSIGLHLKPLLLVFASSAIDFPITSPISFPAPLCLLQHLTISSF
jgi:hypothetical protein